MFICSNYEYVYISGDINAQIAEMTDYTIDEFFDRFFDFDEEMISYCDHKAVLEKYNIQLQRKSRDKWIQMNLNLQK